MKYRNARDIFPEALLRQIQRYVSGETIYIPARGEKKAWGETSGYQQYIRERNAAIRSAFAGGESIEALMERHALSYDSVRRIVYRKKEVAALQYAATLSSAQAYAAAEKLDVWIHLYLNENGRNIPFSDGLKLFDRCYLGPIRMPLSLFRRCAGPEPEMRYQIHPEWFAQHVAMLEKSIREDPDMPPLIVQYTAEGFELNDGNHRFQAYLNLGCTEAWVIVWITETAEYEDFMDKYGSYAKDAVMIRR
ncbi:MAG: ParB N-terminal domain-containing protein [Bacteroidales bacterium]|nr:ParB N-terminal domain-containing protein [Bacteroidales bacterium]MBR4457657.1 ParB N-terminal domain-containing protein [Clostridia bacterium]